jgi:predicted nucleic acid-binding protein
VALYFDSSAVLAFLLQEPEGVETARLWVEGGPRTSSLLLRAECFGNLRRNLPKGSARSRKNWLAEKFDGLSKCLEEVTLKDIDGEILAVLEKQEELSECRTLDAIHLATALYFRGKTDGDFSIVTLDERMRQVAAKLKLNVLPA